MEKDYNAARCAAGEKAAPVALHESKGIFSFAKENIPFGTPRERLLIGSFWLE
jgi:hypothetical protein